MDLNKKTEDCHGQLQDDEYFELIPICCWQTDKAFSELVTKSFNVIDKVVLDYDASTKLELLSNLYHPHIIEPTDIRVTADTKITIFVIRLSNPKIEIGSRNEHINKPLYVDLISFKQSTRYKLLIPYTVFHTPDTMKEANDCFKVFGIEKYINKYVHDHFYDFDKTMIDLDTTGVRYVIIRGFTELPYSPDTDIDLICHPDDLDKLHNVFMRRLNMIQTRKIQINDTSCKYIQYKTKRSPRADIKNTYFHIDVYDNCFTFYNKKVILPNAFLNELFKSRVKNDSYYIPNPDHEYFLLLMRVVLECEYVKKKHSDRLNKLKQSITESELLKNINFIEDRNIKDYFVSEICSKKLVKGVCSYKVSIDDLLAIVWIDPAPTPDAPHKFGRFNLKKINETPHYKFLKGDETEYSDYVRTIDWHTVENFVNLYNTIQNDKNKGTLHDMVVKVEYWDRHKKFIICDGLHRVAILASLGVSTFNINIVEYRSILKDHSEQCKQLINNSKNEN